MNVEVEVEHVVDSIRRGHDTNAKLRKLFPPAAGEVYSKELDRALQRARRSGAIYAEGGRWHLASLMVCPKCRGTGKVAR